MTRKFRVAFLITLLCAGHNIVVADSKPIEVKWRELAHLISGQNVTLDLADGIALKGEVVAVREDSILVDVSSAVRGYGRGNGLIPRDSVRLIHLARMRGGWGRTMGTVIGVMGGIVVGGYAAGHTDSAGKAIPVFLGIASGVGVGGYYAGKGLDKRITHIRIVP